MPVERVFRQAADGTQIDVTYGDRSYGRCECGCGATTNWRSDNTRSDYRPGHDSKLKSRLVRLARAGDTEALAQLRARGWERFLERNSGGNRGGGSRGRKFGIELEIVNMTRAQATQVLLDAGIDVRDFGSYTHRVSSAWKVVYDSSVPNGCEVVSPPLRGRAGFAALKTVMEALTAAGASVNRSCGTHVHHDVNDMTGPQLADMMVLYTDRQAALDTVVAPSRRNGRWTYHWGQSELQSVLSVLRASSGGRRGTRVSADRYKTINIMSYPKYGTIEFRQHQGTLNYAKLERWILMGQAMCEAVKQGRSVRTDLVGMMTDLGLPTETVQWFAERAQGFGFLTSFDAEDLAMAGV